jgi:hypothetical protein
MIDISSFWAFVRHCLTLKTLDFDQMYGYQCTDLIKYYLTEYHKGKWPFIFWWSAKMAIQSKTFLADLNNKFVRVSNKANNYPSAWDIVFWNPYKWNSDGHAAIAMDGCNKYRLYVVEQNGGVGTWTGVWLDIIRKYTYDYIKPGSIAGWFHYIA